MKQSRDEHFVTQYNKLLSLLDVSEINEFIVYSFTRKFGDNKPISRN